jgi:anti-sigma-K factor RskA
MTLCDQYDDQWELLLLGMLDLEVSAALRAHVESGCLGCRERWAEAARLLAALGSATEAVEPPLRVEQRLRQRLHDFSADTAPTPVIPWRRRAGPVWKQAAAAAALAILVAGGWLGWQNAALRRRLAEAERRLESTSAAVDAAGPPPAAPAPAPAAPASPAAASVFSPGPGGPEVARWERERAQLEEAKSRAESARAATEAELAHLSATQQGAAARAAELERTVEQLTAQLRRLEAEAQRRAGAAREQAAAMQVALDERSMRVTLRAVDPLAGQATASAILSPEGRLLLSARGLPPLPADKCYQLWVIRQDDPAIVSAGVVSVSSEGQALHATRIEGRAARVTGFALTDEPLGGSPAARGRKLLFGSVRQR